MKTPFYMTFWFWGLIFSGFLGIIFWGGDLEKDVQSRYARQKMQLTNVKFDELDAGFEHATLYADVVDMDDSQSNMTASNIHAFFFDKMIATKTGELVASWGFKTPFEARFWGNVRLHTSSRERFRGEEMRYFFSRNEMFTSMPVTLWKDDMIVTGRELRYNTQTKEGSIARDVLIRIWEPASATASATTASSSRPRPVRMPPAPHQLPGMPLSPLSLRTAFDTVSTAVWNLVKIVSPARQATATQLFSIPERKIPRGNIASASLSEIAAPGADTE